jgi:hypothetical protein
MKYKLIASDMDQTLLDDNHQICQRNIDMIKKANELGVKFVPITGRGYLTIQNDLKTLGLYDRENEYTVSFNGGAITENKNNRVLSFEGLSFEKVKEIFEYGLNYEVGIHIYTENHVYLYRLPEDMAINFSKRINGSIIMKDTSIDFLKNTPISKISYHKEDMPYLLSLEPKMKNIWENECSVSYSSNCFMEFNRIGVDKGVGLRKLAELLGIDISETIAVGDHYNDMSMLKTAGLSVAAGNAIDDIKNICDVVTEADNNQGVIAEIIEKYIL